MKKNSSYLWLVGLVILGLLILFKSALFPVPIDPIQRAGIRVSTAINTIKQSVIGVSTGIPPIQRAGIGISTEADVPTWAHLLGAEWYINWSVVPAEKNSSPEIWQMVRPLPNGGVKPDQQLIVSIAQKYPGNVWIIGNEPDNIWQDNQTPQAFAHFYHDTYTLIKNADPTAVIAVGGVSQASPLRLSYLDQVSADYRKDFGSPLPADWWTLHGYVLQEKHGSWGVDIPPGFSDQTVCSTPLLIMAA